MSETILRMAKPSDQHRLDELKHRFVQNMYAAIFRRKPCGESRPMITIRSFPPA